MAPHSSILAWRIPWTEEPGGLQGRVAQSWTRPKQFSTYACIYVYMHMYVLCVCVYTYIHMYIRFHIYTFICIYVYLCWHECTGVLYIYTHIHTLTCIYIYIHVYIYQRRQWQPTPVLLPGKSHGRRSLVGCTLWGC